MTTELTRIKQGTVREDGRIFHSYQRRKSGTLREYWMTPEAFQRYRESVRQWIKANPERHRANVDARIDRLHAERFPNSKEIADDIIRTNTIRCWDGFTPSSPIIHPSSS